MHKWRAIMQIDYTGADGNERTKLQAGLVQLGWKWVETSAYTIITSDLDKVFRGVGLVARHNNAVCHQPESRLSHLSYTIQYVENYPDGLGTPAGAANHPTALKEIEDKLFPSGYEE